MSDESTKPFIFISYARADEPENPADGEEKWLTFVQRFLRPAVKGDIFEFWTDRQMKGGDDWNSEIEKKLRSCDIFILLVSASSMASDYIVDKEIPIIRERQEKGEPVHFYPLLLTPTPDAGLAKVNDKNLRPRDRRPLSGYSVHDRAQCMTDVADEIAEIVDALRRARGSAEAPSPIKHVLHTWTRREVRTIRARDITDLAWLETDLRQGAPFDAIPVYASVVCGRPSLTIENHSFNLATWQVLVRIDLENAKIKFGSIPTVKIQIGKIPYTTKYHARTLGLSVGAEMSQNVRRVDGSLVAESSQEQNEHQSDMVGTIDITTDVILIGRYGESVVTIGHPDYGDPDNHHALLSHNYPKERGDDIKPLFVLQPIDADAPIRITMTTTVPFEKLCPISIDSVEMNERREKLVRDAVQRRSNRTIKDYEKAIKDYEMLRKQMMRDEFSRRAAQNQKKAGIRIAENEFAVVIDIFEIKPN
jgi:hypothetical protein